MNRTIVFTTICFAFSFIFAQTTVTLEADGPGQTYELISNTFGGTSYEPPDCSHQDFGRHITEEWDEALQAYVFVFYMHIDIDNDRCVNFDRQRNEIKTYDQSPEHLLARHGETHIYTWKFKVDSGFQASPNFTHMFQIKPRGGSDDSQPALTITMRKGTPDQLQIRHVPSNGSAVTVASTGLLPLHGEWLTVYCRVLNRNDGKVELRIQKSDGTVVLNYSDYQIDMWRTNANFNRPKWGIYRSLLSASDLRDEAPRFASVSVTEPAASAEPNTPSGLRADAVSQNAIEVNWTDESDNETNFHLQRSTDGISWELIAVLDSNETSFRNSFLPTSTKFYYRVRAENWEANSPFSAVDSAITGEITSIDAATNAIPESIELMQNYPNPFNPSTTIAFSIDRAMSLRLEVFDINGVQVSTLINGNRLPGNYTVKWNASGIASGVYYYRLSGAGTSQTRKMLILK